MRLFCNLKEKVRDEKLLLVLSSSLYVFSHPPFDLFFLAYFSLVPLFFLLQDSKPSRSFLIGFFFGFLTFTGLTYWVVIAMHKYGGIDLLSSISCLLLLSSYLALYPALFSYIVSLFETRLGIPILISSPFVWTFTEYLRSILLSGFPWALIVYSQYNFLPLIQISSFSGPYSVSFIIVALNCAIFYFMRPKRVKIGVFASILAFLAFFGSVLYGILRLSENPKETDTLKVQIVQPSIPQDIKWDEPAKMAAFMIHASMVLSSPERVDLIVWPETALPYTIDEGSAIQEALSNLSKEKDGAILLGALSKGERGEIYNSAFLYGKDGRLLGVYRKVKLVPFGEYTPLTDSLPFLERISVSGDNFSPGVSHEPLDLDQKGKLGVLICYEGIFPEICRQTVRRGAKILVNLTNDAWYDRSSAPYQHFSFYVLRAIESERYVIRCANTGISGIIDPRGRVIEKSGLMDVTSIFGEVMFRDSETVYVRYGEWFLISLFVLYSILLFSFYLRKRSSGRISESFGK